MSEFPPGAWADKEGALHLDLPVILRHLGLEDTPANRECLTRYFKEIIRTEYPEVTIVDLP